VCLACNCSGEDDIPSYNCPMSRDLRKYARQTNFQLFAGGILILLTVGIGLIYMFYGREAAVLGLTCLLIGLSPMVLIWLGLLLIEWIARRVDPDRYN